MITVRILAALVLVFFAAPSFAVDPPSRVGRLNHIAGAVSFASADAGNDWTAALLNHPITTGNRLWVDRGGRAEMHVGSTAIRLSEETSVNVLVLDDRAVQLGLVQGGLNVRLRWLPDGDTLQIDTPHGAVLLEEPGSYRVSVDASGTQTALSVRSGRAEVLTREQRISVRAEQQATITGRDVLSYDIAPAPPLDGLELWAAARDRREDRIVSTRYVPREMTGYEDLDEHGTWRTLPEYGSVWVPTGVPAGWAPYRYGRWAWVAPWGWTWIDGMPWGFAPFHYGRWIWADSYWAWAPGPVVVRPVYAPALVAFIGGSQFSVSIGVRSAPAVAWVPLGWREPYIPWYRVSPTYVRNVNIHHVSNINVTHIHGIANQYTAVNNIRYRNRHVPSGVTVARRDDFVAARPVEHLSVSQQELVREPAMSAAPVRAPDRASFAPSRAAPKPPAGATSREEPAARPPRSAAGEERRHVERGASAPPAGGAVEDQARARALPRRENAQATPSPADAQRPPQQIDRGAGRKPEMPPAQPRARFQEERERPTPEKRTVREHDARQTVSPPSAPFAGDRRAGERQIEKGTMRDHQRHDPPRGQAHPQRQRYTPAPELPGRAPEDRAARAPMPLPSAPSASVVPRLPRPAETGSASPRAREEAFRQAQPLPQLERRAPKSPPRRD